MLKKVLINIAKFGLAGGLLVWLVNSGKLDWSLLKEIINHPLRLLSVFGVELLIFAFVTFRLKNLLSPRSTSLLSFKKLYSITWIGAFFNSVLPGSVTGDIIKIWYLKQEDKSFTTPFLLFISFLDRLMGLTGLVILMGFFSLINYRELSLLSEKLVPLLHFNFILLSLVTCSLIIFFFYPQLIQKILQLLPAHRLKSRLESLWLDLSGARKQIFTAISISILVQFMSVFIFHILVSPHYTTNLSLTTLLSFIPLGFMLVAIPISPGGLGVGHMAFQTLFSFAGETNGANLFNFYFVVIMCINLMGSIPWLMLKKKKNEMAN